MATQPRSYLTREEYLAIDEAAEFKSEYYDGEMFPITGATWEHSRLLIRMGRLLDEQLDGRPCAAVGSSLRVRVPSGLYTYPGLTVVSGEPNLDRNTLLNPTLIIEVLSPSTETYGRGAKFDHYWTIESLAEYVTVAQDRVQVMLYARQPDGRWLLTPFTRSEDKVELASISCTIPIGKLYEPVQFKGEPPLHPGR